MANYLKLKIKGENKKNINKTGFARCPAKVTNIKYNRLYKFLPRKGLTRSMQKALEKGVVVGICVRDMAFVYKQNSAKIEKQLSKDLEAHIANLQNVDILYGTRGALESQKEGLEEKIRNIARKNGPKSSEAESVKAEVTELETKIENLRKVSRLPNTEIGKGCRLAAVVRDRIIEAVTEVQEIHDFYVEILRLCGNTVLGARIMSNVLNAHDKIWKDYADMVNRLESMKPPQTRAEEQNRETLEKRIEGKSKEARFAKILKEIEFDAAKVRKAFIQRIILEEKIKMATAEFGVKLSRDGDFEEFNETDGK